MLNYGFTAYLQNLGSSENAPFSLEAAPGWNLWCSKEVQIAAHPFVTTLEAECEVQPVQTPRCVLAYEGRLDDRADLASRLGSSPLSSAPDGTLIAAAYESNRCSIPADLIGEYCFVLYDKLNRQLIAARDPFSPHHLFYTFMPDGSTFVSSDLAHLLRQLPHRTLATDYFAHYWRSKAMPFGSELTPYRNIFRLQPGHMLTVSARGHEIKRYWTPDLSRTIEYRSDADYEEHFRYLFRNAVLNTMRTNGDMLFDVSGGLDSSSITCMAHKLVEEGAVSPRGTIYTYTNVHPNAPTTDESKYWKEVLKQVPSFKHLVVPTDDSSAYSVQGLQGLEPPEPFGAIMYPHYLTFQQKMLPNVRVAVKGYGGDEVLRAGEEGPYHLSALLFRGRPHAWFKELKRCSDGEFGVGLLLWNFTLGPKLFPNRARVSTTPDDFPTWLDAAFVARLERLPDETPRIYPDFAANLHFKWTASTTFCRAYHILDSDLRLPIIYRPLVEFMLTIPWHQKFSPDRRTLQRRAIKGIVPEVVSRRETKVFGQERLIRAAQQNWERIDALLKAPKLAELGYVDVPGLRTAAMRLRHGHWMNQLKSIETAISLELWLQLQEGSPSRAHNGTAAQPEQLQR